LLGYSRQTLRSFPRDVRIDAGRQLEKVQIGDLPDDSKSMPEIGMGAVEIRI
jgi:phage-related protein